MRMGGLGRVGKEEEGGSLKDGGEWVISLEDLCALLQHIYTPLVKSARPCEPLWRAPRMRAERYAGGERDNKAGGLMRHARRQ